MTTETIAKIEAGPTTAVEPAQLPERIALRVDSPIEETKPAEHGQLVNQDDTVEQESIVSNKEKDKPKVRRIIDEEGINTTATVSSNNLAVIPV